MVPYNEHLHCNSQQTHAGSQLQHNNTDTTHLALVRQVLVVDSARNGSGTIVVNVVMELTVSSAELELLEEERVVV